MSEVSDDDSVKDCLLISENESYLLDLESEYHKCDSIMSNTISANNGNKSSDQKAKLDEIYEVIPEKEVDLLFDMDCELKKDNRNSVSIDVNVSDIVMEDHGKAEQGSSCTKNVQYVTSDYQNAKLEKICEVTTEKEVDLFDMDCDLKKDNFNSVPIDVNVSDILMEDHDLILESKYKSVTNDLTIKDCENVKALSQDSSILSGNPQKGKMKEDNCPVFEMNCSTNLDDKQKNFVKLLDTRLSIPYKLDINVYCNSTAENFDSVVDINNESISIKDNEKADQSDIVAHSAEPILEKYLNNEASICSANNCVTNSTAISEISDNVKSCVDTLLQNISLTEKENELITDNFAVSIVENSESIGQKKILSVLGESPQKCGMKKGNNCDLFGMNHAVCLDEIHNFVRSPNEYINNIRCENVDLTVNSEKDSNSDGVENDIQNIETNNCVIKEDNIHLCNNSEKDDTGSTFLGVNLKASIIKGADQTDKGSSKSETELKNIKANNCVVNADKGNVISNEIKSCLDTILEITNVIESDSELSNRNFALQEAIYKELNILYNGIEENRSTTSEKEETFKIAIHNPEMKTVSEDKLIITLSSDNEEENCIYKTFNENVNNHSAENESNLNADEQSRANFREELENELEILKAQYLDIQRKIVNETGMFSVEDVYTFISKVKSELTTYLQSLEQVRVKFRNKWLNDQSKISYEPVRPFHSNEVRPKKTIETVVDRFRYKSRDCTRIKTRTCSLYEEVVESRRSYKRNTEMSPPESIKNLGKFRHFSGSEMKTRVGDWRENKRKLSHYSHSSNFQQFPEERSETSKRSCASKNCTFYSKEGIQNRAKKENSYINEMDYSGKIKEFSKFYAAHEESKFARLNRRENGYITHSKKRRKSSSSDEKLKNLSSRFCFRKSAREGQSKGKCRLRKPYEECLFSSDTSDTIQLSSTSDRESMPIYSNPKYYFGHAKYFNTMSEIVSSFKKNKVSSGKNRYKKKTTTTESESDVSPVYSSDSDSSRENRASFGKKKHKEKTLDKKGGKKSRQKHKQGRKHDSTKPIQDYSVMQKSKGEKDVHRRKYKTGIHSMENMTPEYEKKRKNKVSELVNIPCKFSKTKYNADIHNTRNSDIHNTYETERQTQKYKAKKLKSIIAPVSPLVSTTPAQTGRHKNDKEIAYSPTPNFSYAMKEQSEIEFSNFSSKRDRICDDTVLERDVKDHENDFEKEISNVEDMDSFLLFLNKRKGKYTNAELIFRPPIVTMAQKIFPENELPEITDQVTKCKAGATNKHQAKNSSTEKSQETAENDSAHIKKDSSKRNVLKTKCVPKSKKKNKSTFGKADKNKPVEHKSEIVPVSSSKFDSFKKLNLEITKKNVTKRTPVASKIHDSNVNSESNKFSKPLNKNKKFSSAGDKRKITFP